MFITSNISFLKTQEYFNRISSLTEENKDRRSVFKFIEGLYDLNLWNDIACWFLTTDKNLGINSSGYSLGGLGYQKHPCGYNENEKIGYYDLSGFNSEWNLCGVKFSGNNISYIDTSFNPLSVGIIPTDVTLMLEVIDPHYRPLTSEFGSFGAYESHTSKLSLDISELNPVAFSSSYEYITYTTSVSGSPGVWIASRTETNNAFIHKNGINLEVNTKQAPAPYPSVDKTPNRNMYVGGINSNVFGENSFFSEQHISFAAVLKGISQQKAVELYNLYKRTIIDRREPCISFRGTPTPTPTPTVTPTVTPTPTRTPFVFTTPTPTPTPAPKELIYCLTGCEADERSVVYLDSLYKDTLYYTDGTGYESSSNRVVMYVFVNGNVRADIIFHRSRLGMKFGYTLQGDNVEGARFVGVFTEGRVNFYSKDAVLNPTIILCTPLPTPTPTPTTPMYETPRCPPSPTPTIRCSPTPTPTNKKCGC